MATLQGRTLSVVRKTKFLAAKVLGSCQLSSQTPSQDKGTIPKPSVKPPSPPAVKPPSPPAKEPEQSSVNTDNSSYQVPEYYQHTDMTFYDIELDMINHRLVQPSKFQPIPPKTS